MRLFVETEPTRAKELYISEALSKVEKGPGHFNSKRAYIAVKALKSQKKKNLKDTETLVLNDIQDITLFLTRLFFYFV